MYKYIWRQTFIGAYYIMKNIERDSEPGGRLILKMPSYRYIYSHYKDKTILRPFNLYNGNPIPEKTVFILKQSPAD